MPLNFNHSERKKENETEIGFGSFEWRIWFDGLGFDLMLHFVDEMVLLAVQSKPNESTNKTKWIYWADDWIFEGHPDLWILNPSQWPNECSKILFFSLINRLHNFAQFPFKWTIQKSSHLFAWIVCNLWVCRLLNVKKTFYWPLNQLCIFSYELNFKLKSLWICSIRLLRVFCLIQKCT